MSGFRDHYKGAGPEGYYREHGDGYHNPHEPAVIAALTHAVREWAIDWSHVLDLAAGSGEATMALLELVPEAVIEGIDPFTQALYQRRTGRVCQAVTFEQLAQGEHVLGEYSCVVSSCALHLAEESWLAPLCMMLALATPNLVVITPLTRPEIRPAWGWQLHEAVNVSEQGKNVRVRWYRRCWQVDA